MNSRKLKKFTPMFPAALLLLLGIWLIVAGNDYLPFLRRLIRQEQEDIARLKNQITTMAEENQKMASELSGLIAMRKRSMNSPEQQATENFRERVDKAIVTTGLRSRSLSGIRKTELASKCILLEIGISADGQIDQVIAFLDNLYREKPQLYWRSISIKPDNLTKPEYLTLSGTLCALSFVGYEPEEPPPPPPAPPEAEGSTP